MWLVQRLPQAGPRFAWPRRLQGWLPALPALLFLAVFFIVPVVEILQGGLYDADGVLSIAQFARMTHSGADRVADAPRKQAITTEALKLLSLQDSFETLAGLGAHLGPAEYWRQRVATRAGGTRGRCDACFIEHMWRL